MKARAIILAVVVVLLHSVAWAGQLGSGDDSIDRIALFRAVGAMYGLDPALLGAIATAESNNKSQAVSAKGAIGLMQLMPATASEFNVADPFDPVDNALGAARLLDYLRRHPGCRALPQLLAAYNAGAGAVKHYQGIPPYPETREYVRRVLWLYLLGTRPPVESGHGQTAAKDLSPNSSIKRQTPVSSDQAILDQLADLKRERAAAVKAH